MTFFHPSCFLRFVLASHYKESLILPKMVFYLCAPLQALLSNICDLKKSKFLQRHSDQYFDKWKNPGFAEEKAFSTCFLEAFKTVVGEHYEHERIFSDI